MITVVYFDWGGVLIDDPATCLRKYCAGKLETSQEKFDAAFFTHHDDFQRGLSEKNFWEKSAQTLA